MKRTRSTTSPSRPQKSSRLASKQPAKLFAEQHAFSRRKEDPFDFEYTFDLCRKYNRFLPFAQGHSTADSQFAPYPPGREFQRGMEEINKTLEQAYHRVQSKVDVLEASLRDFTDATLGLSRWYEGGDILSLDAEEMDRVLASTFYPDGSDDAEAGPVTRNDMDGFVAYVQRIIPEAFQKSSTAEEDYPGYSNSRKQFRDVPPVLVKCFKLAQTMIDHDREKDALHVLVLLKSVFRKVNERTFRTNFELAHAMLDRAIRDFIAEVSDMGDAKGPNLTCTIGDDPLCLHMETDGMKRHHSSEESRHSRYWDFAAATRPLQTAYFSNICDNKEIDKNAEFDDDTYTCFHSNSFDLLHRLQIKAWSEIRSNVFQTIGTLLPTELTERIFEFALAAEEIPLQPKVYQDVLVQPPEDMVQGAVVVRKVEPAPTRCRRRLEERYKCCVLERKNVVMLEWDLPGDPRT